MATPAAKRRRIDEASQTLSKPFRSPFKTPFKSPLKITPADTTTLQCSTPLLSTSKHLLALDPANSPSLPVPSSSIATPRQHPTEKSFTSPVAAAALNADPDIAPLLRQQRELEKQLRELKEELDTAQQAKKIEDSSRKKIPDGDIDAELIELTTKWKAASRQAAEELFGQVRDRVNRMGGPRAFKEMQKKQQEYQNSWNEEEQKKNDDDDEDEDGKVAEKRDVYAEYDIEPETENEKSQRANGVGDTGELPGQEDEFTMAMMLRTLNVDLDVIGYDKQQQIWVD